MERQTLIYARANGVSAFIHNRKDMEKWQREAEGAEDEGKDMLRRMIAYERKYQRKAVRRNV